MMKLRRRETADLEVLPGDSVMGIFLRKNKELEELCRKVDLEAENNYKDAAQEAFANLEKRFEEICEEGKMKEKMLLYYQGELEKRRKMMENFHH